jgi:branched-chain amino acid aminotransferase
MIFYNYNGKIFSENENIIGPTNRGLRYGDGIFETIKFKNANIVLADDHFKRLWLGMRALQFSIPIHFSVEKLTAEINALIKKNKLKEARIRITIIRSDGGIYDPKNDMPNYIIEAIKLPEDNGLLNNNGLQMCIYEDALKSIDTFSNLKTNNYLPYFMGAKFAKNQYCNDAIILNSKRNICDSTIANIFFIKDKVIYTVALTEGCVAGVIRNWLINTLRILNYKVEEIIVTKSMLYEADEIFLSNSIYNIRWVGSLDDKNYTNIEIQKMNELLQRKYAAIFC